METIEAMSFYESSISSGDESDQQLEELYGLPSDTNTLKTQAETILTNSKRKSNENGRQRQPTRRPDPNVYNRNALLARENRKKKKAHLETLEQSLQEYKRVNAKLLAELKRQRKLTRRVERERQYYKNIVNNRADIANLVAALNGRLRDNVAPTNINQNFLNTSPTRDSFYSRSGSSSYEPDYQAFENFDNFSSDNNDEIERQPSIALAGDWSELLQDKDLGFGSEHQPSSSEADTTDILANINEEHSYVNQSNNNNNSDADETLKDIGICLHVKAGKVSLEFCPACNWHANQTLPQQLLQEHTAAAAST